MKKSAHYNGYVSKRTADGLELELIIRSKGKTRKTELMHIHLPEALKNERASIGDIVYVDVSFENGKASASSIERVIPWEEMIDELLDLTGVE